MKPSPSRRAGWLVAAVTAAVAAVPLVVTATLADLPATDGGSPAVAPARSGAPWVHTWAAMPQLTEPHNMPPAPFTGTDRVLADATLRQTVRATVGGDRLRLRLSNAFGGADLPVTRATVARPAGGRAGVSAIEPGSARPLTFGGRAATVVPAGAQMVSDPVDVAVTAGTSLTVTLYLADGQASTDITSHPGSRTTSYLLAGDHVAAADLPGATPTDHWYFISGLEVTARGPHAAVAVLGDSLSDGRGSTTNGNNRWPDRLFDRLQRHRPTADVAVINQAAGGNRVLDDGLGPNALARLDRDVLALTGARWLIVLHGINDIGTAPATPAAQRAVADDLIAAYGQIVVRAHAQGIRVYGATLLPFGGNTGYDDPDGHREAARQRVNAWIRDGGRFDAVVDLDRAVRDPQQPRRLLPAYDDGDHLHLNPVGYQRMADAVPLGLFRR